MRRVVREVAGNVNAVLVLGGFAALEWGVSQQWSDAVASIVGGVVLMAAGSWPYLRSKGKP